MLVKLILGYTDHSKADQKKKEDKPEIEVSEDTGT